MSGFIKNSHFMAFYLVVKIFPHTGIVVIRKNVLCEKGGITKITGSVI